MRLLALLVLTACAAPPEPVVPVLRFARQQGKAGNLFLRRGQVAAHLVVKSGARPRLLVAFPAGNSGAALWFDRPAALRATGELSAEERAGGLRGVRARIASPERVLVVRAAALGSIRVLRDVDRGQPAPPETAYEVERGPPLRLHRRSVDGAHRYELALAPEAGTRIDLSGGHIAFAAAEGRGVAFTLVALTDEPPLSPIPAGEILSVRGTVSGRDLDGLAFLAYDGKLCAGSWRFLTYFGRDTLLSLHLLASVLRPRVIEAGLSSVLERLAPDGQVAHEEDIGDFAALAHARAGRRGDRTPIHDYKMIDEDFLLAPVAAAYLLDSAAGRARAASFLARRDAGGRLYRELLARNLALVLRHAEPYAAAPSARSLVALEPGQVVGQWRDTDEGLGGGRIPFDVNAALVPAALAAAARLYASGLVGDRDRAGRAAELASIWKDAGRWFRIEIPAAEARRRVAAYAVASGLDAGAAADVIDAPVVFPALALDAEGQPIPIAHTDIGFRLAFGEPDARELIEMSRLLRPFPAGLLTPYGAVIANPAYAPAGLQATFTPAHYAGAVIHSWQQALLLFGLRRQAARELPASTRAALLDAERRLREALARADQVRTAELWTWRADSGRIALVPYGDEAAHEDEANAVQLWSTVYLALR